MAEDVSEAVRTLDLPGEGERLQVRRESVRAAYDYLAQRGTAGRAEFVADVYGEYESSFAFADLDADEWWERYVAPGLRELPNVGPPDADERWTFEE